MLSVIVLTVLTTVYAVAILTFTVGIIRTHRHKGSATPYVSVVIPMRNEEQFLQRTLDALDAQEYDGQYEIICVDDRSTDSTGKILDEFVATHSDKFRALHLDPSLPKVESPKKRALEAGFKEAKGEVLLIMDADCVPTKRWLASMAGRFEGDIAIVQGPKRNTGGWSPVHQYQRLETLAYTSIEAAGFSLGHPMLASAACLAYKKDLFFKVGGFGDLVNLSSGDDDMLIHKMIKEPGVQFCYNLSADALIDTAPVDSLKALFFQRARWSSNGTKYDSHLYTLGLSLIYTFLVWLLVSPFLVAFAGFPIAWFAIPMGVKVLCDLVFLSCAAVKLHSKQLLLALPVTEIMQVPINVFAVPFGILGLFKWK